MELRKALELQATYPSANRGEGIALRSRGKFFQLDFNIELVDGKIAVVATVPRTKDDENADESEAVKPAKAARK